MALRASPRNRAARFPSRRLRPLDSARLLDEIRHPRDLLQVRSELVDSCQLSAQSFPSVTHLLRIQIWISEVVLNEALHVLDHRTRADGHTVDQIGPYSA